MTYQPYSIRFRPDERKMLKEIARRFDKSQQEMVRSLVRGAFEYLEEREQQEQKEQPTAA